SDCTVGGIYTSGFHFAPPKDVYGVVKCYTTKVGEGPFPSELKDKTGDDLPALEYACKVGGINKLIMTKFDILAGMEKVPVCATYGKPPKNPRDFFDVTPQNIQLNGWKTAGLIQKFVHELETDIEPGSEYDFEFQGFDEGLRNFIEQVEKSVGRSIEYISCGTDDK